jgi:hypothetical protein
MIHFSRMELRTLVVQTRTSLSTVAISHARVCILPGSFPRLCTWHAGGRHAAHSPPLPLIIDRVDKNHCVNAADEERIILALRHRDRVRRIRLLMPIANLQKLILSLGGEFPMLEYLYVSPLTKHNTSLILPETLDAPHLRHLILKNFAFPMRSPLLTTSVGLNTLYLDNIHLYPYFSPYNFLRWLSRLPQLETRNQLSLPCSQP